MSGSGYRGKKDETTGGYVGGAKNRWGILGNIRAIEITDGDAHGWHPHLHVLCFHDTPLSPGSLQEFPWWTGGPDGSLQEFRAWWSNRWARWVKRNLGRATSTPNVRRRRGAGRRNRTRQRRPGRVRVEDPLAVEDSSVTSDLKRGRRENRTPWQIASLDAADTGDCRECFLDRPLGRVLPSRHTKGRWVVVSGVQSPTSRSPRCERSTRSTSRGRDCQCRTTRIRAAWRCWCRRRARSGCPASRRSCRPGREALASRTVRIARRPGRAIS